MADALEWRAALCVVAAVNVAAWFVSLLALRRRWPRLDGHIRATRRRLLVLSGLYVAGCAFRSVFPMIDVPRLCLHDTGVSRVAVGRTVATIAELAFAAQWALMLFEAGSRRAARFVLPAIAVAELFSWAAVLTRNNLYHAIENALWTATAAVAAGFLASRWRHESDLGRRVIAVALACAGGYLAFMLTVDIPMYLARWHPGEPPLPLAEGLREILATCRVERGWSAWREDALWLTLYFSVAVWMSLALAHAPSLRNRRRPGAGT